MAPDDATEGPIPIGSAAFFQAIVETSVDPFVVVDRDLILRYASPSIEVLLGWPPDAWLGQSIAELLEPESLDVTIQGLDELDRGPAESRPGRPRRSASTSRT